MRIDAGLLNDLSDGLLILDGEARIRFASRRAVQMLGCQEGEQVGNLMIERSVKSAIQGYTTLPVSLRVRPGPEGVGNTGEITALINPGSDPNEFVVLLHNVSEERLFITAWSNLLYFVHYFLGGKTTALHISVEKLRTALRGHPPEGEVGTAADELIHGVVDLSSTMDELLELADFGGADLLSERQRIAPVDLVQEAIREVSRSAARKSLWISKTGFDDPVPPVYGSHGWLRRALVAYLEYLVAECVPGTGLDVSLRYIGGHVVIAVRTLGESIGIHARDDLFVPFSEENLAETRKGVRLPHLGLALAKSVVVQHGGQVRIAATGGTVSLMMELPTDLPPHAGAETGFDQAMRYAQEMKALVLSRGNRVSGANSG